MIIAALPDAQTAAAIVTLLFSMSLSFNGVFVSPTALPGFWIFMYRVSPFTYWVSGLAAVQLHGRKIVCSSTETSVFNPPAGQTCGQFLADYLTTSGGQLQNPTATSNCEYCSLTDSDQYLAGVSIYYDQRWRDWGIFWAYIGFNIFAATLLYYVFRVANFKNFTLKKKSANKAANAAKAVVDKPPHSTKTQEGAETSAVDPEKPAEDRALDSARVF